jgi:hypothetical protein
MRSHLTVAFESMSARRPLPGFMATVPIALLNLQCAN